MENRNRKFKLEVESQIPNGPVWSWLSGNSCQFNPKLLVLGASSVLRYWPFGPVWSRLSAPSRQCHPEFQALRASFILSFWPFGPVRSWLYGTFRPVWFWSTGPSVWTWCTGPPGQLIPNLLALWASLDLLYWRFGPVWSWLTGPSGQCGSDWLALRASLCPTSYRTRSKNRNSKL